MGMSANHETILVEAREQVLQVTLNRPEQMNAINAKCRDELTQVFNAFRDDNGLRALVITGAGRAFSAGADLKDGSVDEDVIDSVESRWWGDFRVALANTGKPTIAAVNGLAFAGGWLLIQMCDLCIAAEHATFGITEARVGRGMPWAVPLVSMVQQRAVMELLLTGEAITAQRAHEIGFVNHVVPGPEVLPRAIAMAEKIAANAPLTVRAARELVYLATEMGRSAGLRAADHLFEKVYLSEDAQEGPRAFREKRKPDWKGR